MQDKDHKETSQDSDQNARAALLCKKDTVSDDDVAQPVKAEAVEKSETTASRAVDRDVRVAVRDTGYETQPAYVHPSIMTPSDFAMADDVSRAERGGSALAVVSHVDGSDTADGAHLSSGHVPSPLQLIQGPMLVIVTMLSLAVAGWSYLRMNEARMALTSTTEALSIARAERASATAALDGAKAEAAGAVNARVAAEKALTETQASLTNLQKAVADIKAALAAVAVGAAATATPAAAAEQGESAPAAATADEAAGDATPAAGDDAAAKAPATEDAPAATAD